MEIDKKSSFIGLTGFELGSGTLNIWEFSWNIIFLWFRIFSFTYSNFSHKIITKFVVIQFSSNFILIIFTFIRKLSWTVSKNKSLKELRVYETNHTQKSLTIKRSIFWFHYSSGKRVMWGIYLNLSYNTEFSLHIL